MITLNGVPYSGRNIEISQRNVRIDGDLVGGLDLTNGLKIHVSGNLVSLTCDGSVTMDGDVLGNATSGGSMKCGNVGGRAEAGGSLKAAKVGGSVTAGGSVKIGS